MSGQWHRICRVDEVEAGHPVGRVVGGSTDGDHQVCVVMRPGGGFVAMLDRCPHRDTPLSRGLVKDGMLTCPGHFWRFDLTTGERSDLPEVRTTLYPTRVADGWVEASLPPPAPRRSMREWLLAQARVDDPRRTAAMTETMRAVVLDAPGPPEALTIRELPRPVPMPGWVLIRVKAFGLNRSELHTRLGLAQGVTFPRVLGIEATGVVAACPGGEFAVGQQVMAMMGGMGRAFDGGYAEYTCVPAAQVIPFSSSLDWSTLGAVPEMLQTAYGSLTVGLDARPGQSLLIRGGTSSIGMATAILAKRHGMTVLATTRNPAKASALSGVGVDHVFIDDDDVASQVRAIFPDGVDAALELVGTPTLPDTLRSVRVHGVVCFTGMLSNQWTVRDFYPIDYLPRGVRLSAYGGDAGDLPPAVLQAFLDDVAAGTAQVPIARVYDFAQIVEAHAAMEASGASGKLVVLT